MFRKDPGIKPLANIKSSERRKIITAFVNEQGLPQAIANEIVPGSIKKATFKSPLATGEIFATDDKILFFKTRDSKLMPTVHTLWKCPTLLPVILTNGFVVEKLYGGADLMVPGTLPPFSSKCIKGQLVAIADYKTPWVAIAVGTLAVDLFGLESVVGLTGVAVKVLHTAQDKIAVFGVNKVKIPDNSECEELVKQFESLSVSSDVGEGTITETTNEQGEDCTVQQDETSKNSEEQDRKQAAPDVSAENIEYLFKRAFLYSLYEGVKTPITASSFMEDHILKNLPYFPESMKSLVTIKKTHWKKSAKFVKDMEKLKYLKTKGKDDSLTIVEVVSKDNNEEIKNFVPHKIRKANSNKIDSGKTNDGVEKHGKTKANKLQILDFYKPTAKSRSFLNDLNAKFDQYYTSKEITTLVQTYIAKHNLVDSRNKKNVHLDTTLKDLISAKLVKDVMARPEVSIAVMGSFTKMYKILKPNEELDLNTSPPVKGTPGSIKIISETKIGRKVITRVSNFEHFDVVTDQDLAKHLKVACSGSATINQCKENPKLKEVTVQGPHCSIIKDFFVSKGVSDQYISVTDKVRKK